MDEKRKKSKELSDDDNLPKQWNLYKESANVLPKEYKEFKHQDDFNQAYKITKAFSKLFVKADALNNKSRKKDQLVYNPNISCALYEYQLEGGSKQRCILMDCSGVKDQKFLENMRNFVGSKKNNCPELLEYNNAVKDVQVFIVESVSDETKKHLKLKDREFTIFKQNKEEEQKGYNCSEPTTYVEIEKLIQQGKSILGTAHFSVWLDQDLNFMDEENKTFSVHDSCRDRCQEVARNENFYKETNHQSEHNFRSAYRTADLSMPYIKRELSPNRTLSMSPPENIDKLKKQMYGWSIKELEVFIKYCNKTHINSEDNDVFKKLKARNKLTEEFLTHSETLKPVAEAAYLNNFTHYYLARFPNENQFKHILCAFEDKENCFNGINFSEATKKSKIDILDKIEISGKNDFNISKAKKEMNSWSLSELKKFTDMKIKNNLSPDDKKQIDELKKHAITIIINKWKEEKIQEIKPDKVERSTITSDPNSVNSELMTKTLFAQTATTSSTVTSGIAGTDILTPVKKTDESKQKNTQKSFMNIKTLEALIELTNQNEDAFKNWLKSNEFNLTEIPKNTLDSALLEIKQKAKEEIENEENQSLLVKDIKKCMDECKEDELENFEKKHQFGRKYFPHLTDDNEKELKKYAKDKIALASPDNIKNIIEEIIKINNTFLDTYKKCKETEDKKRFINEKIVPILRKNGYKNKDLEEKKYQPLITFLDEKLKEKNKKKKLDKNQKDSKTPSEEKAKDENQQDSKTPSKKKAKDENPQDSKTPSKKKASKEQKKTENANERNYSYKNWSIGIAVIGILFIIASFIPGINQVLGGNTLLTIGLSAVAIGGGSHYTNSQPIKKPTAPRAINNTQISIEQTHTPTNSSTTAIMKKLNTTYPSKATTTSPSNNNSASTQGTPLSPNSSFDPVFCNSSKTNKDNDFSKEKKQDPPKPSQDPPKPS